GLEGGPAHGGQTACHRCAARRPHDPAPSRGPVPGDRVDRSAQAQAWALPGWTEEEWACRQVISYVDSELAIKRRNPALAKEWVARLEAELRGHLRHAGAPRLHPNREPKGEPDH